MEEKLTWLYEKTGLAIKSFVESQLGELPQDSSRKRITVRTNVHAGYEIACRTWRLAYTIVGSETIEVCGVRSGYTKDELVLSEDKYGDKECHIKFIEKFEREG